MKKRCSGILMPVSSLPGGYGIGSMGQAARDFVDFLVLAGQSVWQILPVGPTSYGDSPYQSCSAFAGNPYFIDLDQLAADGLLKPEDYAKENWGTNPNYCDYALLYQKRYRVLRKAYAAFLQQRPVLPRALLQKLPRGAVIIDLASLPGGTDFAAAEALGLHAEHALALPGRCAPQTAGALIAQTVLAILEERGDEERSTP